MLAASQQVLALTENAGRHSSASVGDRLWLVKDSRVHRYYTGILQKGYRSAAGCRICGGCPLCRLLTATLLMQAAGCGMLSNRIPNRRSQNQTSTGWKQDSCRNRRIPVWQIMDMNKKLQSVIETLAVSGIMQFLIVSCWSAWAPVAGEVLRQASSIVVLLHDSFRWHSTGPADLCPTSKSTFRFNVGPELRAIHSLSSIWVQILTQIEIKFEVQNPLRPIIHLGQWYPKAFQVQVQFHSHFQVRCHLIS